MGRNLLRVRLLALVIGLSSAMIGMLHVHPAAAAMTSGGTFTFTFKVEAYPCPLSCGSGVTGTFYGTVTGLDVWGRPFVASFTSTNDLSGFATNGQACSGDPSGELEGGGGADLTASNGSLSTVLANGATTISAVNLNFSLSWWQYGTSVVLFETGATLVDSSGTTVQSNLLGGDGTGTLVPVWTPFAIPLSCFDQFPATITVAGTFAASA